MEAAHWAQGWEARGWADAGWEGKATEAARQAQGWAARGWEAAAKQAQGMVATAGRQRRRRTSGRSHQSQTTRHRRCRPSRRPPGTGCCPWPCSARTGRRCRPEGIGGGGQQKLQHHQVREPQDKAADRPRHARSSRSSAKAGGRTYGNMAARYCHAASHRNPSSRVPVVLQTHQYSPPSPARLSQPPYSRRLRCAQPRRCAWGCTRPSSGPCRSTGW